MVRYVITSYIGETCHSEEFDDFDEAEHYYLNMQITADVFKEECENAGNDCEEPQVTFEEIED